MREQTFSELIRNQYKYGGMTIKLLMINFAVFLFLNILGIFQNLFLSNVEWIGFIEKQFILDVNLNNFIWHPWTIVTSIFAHVSFFHLFSNLLMLFFAGQLFEQLFDGKRLLYTYVLGGIAGGILEIIAHIIFPALQQTSTSIIGASGAIMAIFSALAFYRPNLTVKLFGLLEIRLIFLALIFILSDFLSLGKFDGTAHFAHLGGILFGVLSIQNIHGTTNIITRFQQLFKRNGTRLTVKKGGRTAQFKSDEDYNLEAKQRQAKVDEILDKISKSGYESLTKSEKDFLFRQSQNGK